MRALVIPLMQSPRRRISHLVSRILPLISCLLLACSLLTGPYLAPVPTATPLTTPSPLPPSPLPPITPAPTPIQSLTPDPSADVSLLPSDLITHPDPVLYSGDLVSFEVLIQNPGETTVQNLPITIYYDFLGGPVLADGRYDIAGLGRREQATFTWAWDTTGLVGPQNIVVALDPSHEFLRADPILANNLITVTLELLPANARPEPEPEARWAQSETECCVFHYLTGTAAERDLALIEAAAEENVRAVAERLGVTRQRKLDFTLLSRLLGHGGFASDTIAITYIDRNYAGGGLPLVFRHEATHLLDRGLAERRPAIMTEGFAVYIAGGHFKPENLEARAVAVLALDRYIPLAELADDFYPAQHEIGYLEAGAFIDFLVNRYGWESFKRFYGSFCDAPSDSAMLDGGLRLNFGKSLAEMEADWLDHLRAQPVDPAQVADVRDTVAFYDTVRRYQSIADPSAHYANAWLPNVSQMRERGLVADYLRHPNAPANIALETMLVEAAAAINRADYASAEWLIASVNAVLGGGEIAPDSRPGAGAFADPLAAQYLAVALSADAAGYEAQRIELDGISAQVAAIRDWPTLEQLTFTQAGGEWILSSQ